MKRSAEEPDQTKKLLRGRDSQTGNHVDLQLQPPARLIRSPHFHAKSLFAVCPHGSVPQFNNDSQMEVLRPTPGIIKLKKKI